MLVAVAAMLFNGVIGAAVRLVGACVVAAARVVAAVLAAAAALVAHITGRRLLLPATQMLLTATQISSEECEERRECHERPPRLDTRVICCLIRVAVVRRAVDAGSAGSHLSPCVHRQCAL